MEFALSVRCCVLNNNEPKCRVSDSNVVVILLAWEALVKAVYKKDAVVWLSILVLWALQLAITICTGLILPKLPSPLLTWLRLYCLQPRARDIARYGTCVVLWSKFVARFELGWGSVSSYTGIGTILVCLESIHISGPVGHGNLVKRKFYLDVVFESFFFVAVRTSWPLLYAFL